MVKIIGVFLLLLKKAKKYGGKNMFKEVKKQHAAAVYP